MKKMCLLLLIAAFVATAFAATVSAKAPAEVVYETKFGNVTFDHDMHKSQGCKTCHHTGDFTSCKDCHNGDSAVKAKDAYHQSCKGCHEEKAAGPTKCKECHVK